MKLGLSLKRHADLGSSVTERVDTLARQVIEAERLGFDSVNLGHHYLTRSSFLQPVPLAGYLAARTAQIELVFGVHLLPLHNPVAVAEELATLDVLSAGRIIAGFGSGYRKVEYDAFGVPFDERFRRLDENVRVVKALWRGDEVSVDGAFGRLDRARVHLRPSRPGGLPIWLGGFTDAGARRAARLGVSWLAPPGGDIDALTSGLAAYRAERDRHGVTDPVAYPVLREGLIDSRREVAREIARPHLEAQYREYKAWKHDETIDHLLDRTAIVGDQADALARLRELASAGFDHVIVRVEWPGMDTAAVDRSIAALAEVLPEVHRMNTNTEVRA